MEQFNSNQNNDNNCGDTSMNSTDPMQQQHPQTGSYTNPVEDLTDQLNCMSATLENGPCQTATISQDYHFNLTYPQQDDRCEDSSMSDEQEPNQRREINDVTSQPNQSQQTSDILIVTNVDSTVFNDELVQRQFESLFQVYDPNITFRYLKSFRRVRLDFADARAAELARFNLSQFKFNNNEFKCYPAQIIRANSNNVDNIATMNSTHLNIPKLTKQFLISPPASPPVGWEPVHEGSPVIDVQLISAIANLVPGKIHEIHPASESQPGICVEVCEDVQYHPNVPSTEVSQRSFAKTIPKTMSPARYQAMNSGLSINH